jgi:hypothetical protein
MGTIVLESHRTLLENLMRPTYQVLAALIIGCFLSHTAFAERSSASEDPVPRFFSLDDPKQGDFDPSAGKLTSDTNQIPVIVGKTMAASPTPLTGREKFHFCLRSTYGPKSIISSVAISAIKQARNSAPEWGQGMEGYGKRFASSFGQKAVEHTIQFGVGGLLGEDPRYFASARTGVFRRGFYAAGQTFVSHKDSGNIGFAYSRLIGDVGGVFISRQWHPDSERLAVDYISEIGSSIFMDLVKNVFDEFWPDIKRRLHH